MLVVIMVITVIILIIAIIILFLFFKSFCGNTTTQQEVEEFKESHIYSEVYKSEEEEKSYPSAFSFFGAPIHVLNCLMLKSA